MLRGKLEHETKKLSLIVLYHLPRKHRRSNEQQFLAHAAQCSLSISLCRTGKAFFWFGRSEIVSSSINGGGGRRSKKDNAKNLPKLESTSLFFLVRSAAAERASFASDDPNMAAQTEYKNARAQRSARVGAISGSNQQSHAALPSEFTRWSRRK